MPASLQSLLSANKTKVDSTHTRIGDNVTIWPGAYKFDNETELYKAIYNEVVIQGNPEFLTEKQRPVGTFVVDLDFRYDTSITTRQHTKDDADTILCKYLDIIKDVFVVDASFNAYILEKPSVNCTPKTTKDGIHLIFTFDADRESQLEVRQRIIESGINVNLPLTNSWEDILDKGISAGNTNWMIYGCRKPDHDVYKITRAYQCTFDPMDNEWMMQPINISNPISYELFMDISVRTQHHTLMPKVKVEKTNVSNNTYKCDNQTAHDMLIELSHILDIKYIDGYHSWRDIVWSLLSDNQNNRELARTISKRSNKYDDISFDKLCDLFRPGHYSIGTFYALCRESSKEKYDEIRKKYDIPRLIELNDLDDIYLCSVKISKTLKNTLVLCEEQWYAVEPDTNIWCKIKSPDFYVSTEIRKYIEYTNCDWSTKVKNSNNTEEKDKTVEQIKLLLKYYKTTNTTAYRSTVITYLKSLLRDNHFYRKLNTTPYVLAFKNGIVDLKTGIFRRGIYASDYITETIPYNYAPENLNKRKFLKDTILKIMNNNEEHYNYLLSLIGYAFLGMPHLEKSMYFMIDGTGGKGDNGKSLLFDILTELAPCYVYKSLSTLLEKDNTKSHKQLVNTKGKRLVWMDEMAKANKINPELMKLIGDGKQIENEIMFGTTENINVLFKMFILSNHIPNLDANQIACYNRYKQVSFCSHFDRTGTLVSEDIDKLKFKADPNLSDTIKKNYVNEVWGLIIEYAKKYCDNGMPNIPAQFLRDAVETQTKNDKFKMWFNDNMENVSNERASLEQMAEISGFKLEFIKEGMERLNYKYDKDLCKLGKKYNGKYYKGGYEGCKIKNQNNDNENHDSPNSPNSPNSPVS